jgi:hypothetical protein
MITAIITQQNNRKNNKSNYKHKGKKVRLLKPPRDCRNLFPAGTFGIIDSHTSDEKIFSITAKHDILGERTFVMNVEDIEIIE